jgi:hypothetical protein
MPLTQLWGGVNPARALQLHFGCLQHRGGMKIENEDKFLRQIVRQDEAEGCAAGCYRNNLRYMIDAQAMGDEEQIRALRESSVARGVHRRVRSPITAGSLALLRGQRRNFIPTNSREIA